MRKSARLTIVSLFLVICGCSKNDSKPLAPSKGMESITDDAPPKKVEVVVKRPSAVSAMELPRSTGNVLPESAAADDPNAPENNADPEKRRTRDPLDIISIAPPQGWIKCTFTKSENVSVMLFSERSADPFMPRVGFVSQPDINPKEFDELVEAILVVDNAKRVGTPEKFQVNSEIEGQIYFSEAHENQLEFTKMVLGFIYKGRGYIGVSGFRNNRKEALLPLCQEVFRSIRFEKN